MPLKKGTLPMSTKKNLLGQLARDIRGSCADTCSIYEIDAVVDVPMWQHNVKSAAGYRKSLEGAGLVGDQRQGLCTNLPHPLSEQAAN
ncbi:MAG: hypothetical protein CYPHOPRED_002089 [Cyphobasidiales sp. Tagirdzhanova-0007]|nr:MAG: hypothetical protein CYPHOPRED_002089 [Cyphobasidiales sp. Tagirdzhanova-0007]